MMSKWLKLISELRRFKEKPGERLRKDFTSGWRFIFQKDDLNMKRELRHNGLNYISVLESVIV